MERGQGWPGGPGDLESIPALPQTLCVTLGESLSSVPQFLRLSSGAGARSVLRVAVRWPGRGVAPAASTSGRAVRGVRSCAQGRVREPEHRGLPAPHHGASPPSRAQSRLCSPRAQPPQPAPPPFGVGGPAVPARLPLPRTGSRRPLPPPASPTPVEAARARALLPRAESHVSSLPARPAFKGPAPAGALQPPRPGTPQPAHGARTPFCPGCGGPLGPEEVPPGSANGPYRLLAPAAAWGGAPAPDPAPP